MAEMYSQARASSPYELVPNTLRYTFNNLINICTGISDSASKKEILAGVEEFHKKTCIKFVPRRSEKDFVHIKPIGG